MAEAIFFSTTASQARFDQVIAVVKASGWPQDSKDLISGTIAKLRELWNRRNEIMHNPVIATPTPEGNKYWLKMKKMGRRDFDKQKPLSLKDLKEHADRLDELGNALHDFVWADIIEMLEEFERTKSAR